MTDAERERAAEWARSIVSAPWFTGVHKQPPFRAHSFDNDGRYWVVGSTNVSALHGWHGSQDIAEILAEALNDAIEAREAHIKAPHP